MSETPEPKVLIGILPERNGVPTADILFDLLAIAIRGHSFVRTQYARTDLQRNKLAEHLLRTDYTHLLMLDADHRHPSDIVERLTRWVKRDPQKLVIAGLAFRRGQPYDPQAYVARDGGRLYQPTEFKPGLVKVDFAGTAAMLISREVFLRLPRPWFAFDYRGATEGKWPGEDIWFCEACRAAGINVWVDMTCISPHLAESWIDEKTYETFREMMAESAEAAGQSLTEDDLSKE
jgi:hypothetical protein